MISTNKIGKQRSYTRTEERTSNVEDASFTSCASNKNSFAQSRIARIGYFQNNAQFVGWRLII